MNNEQQLPAAGFLASFDPAELDRLAGCGEFVSASSGEIIITEGKPQDQLYVLISGKAKVTQKKVAPTVTAWVAPGESFGEINLFDPSDAGASASVTADEDCQLWWIDRDRLNEFMTVNSNTNAQLLLALCTLLSKRQRVSNQSIVDLSHWGRA